MLLSYRFYQRNNKGHLVNAPYVDNSYKWAGGGFMSTVEDLVKFGNSMLYSKQMAENRNTAGQTTVLIDKQRYRILLAELLLQYFCMYQNKQVAVLLSD